MKTLAPPLLAAALALGLPLAADPLDRKQVPADAQWVIHLDAALFQKTQVGAAFLDRVLNPKSAQGKVDLKRELDFDLDWRRVQSITAYGLTLQPWGQQDPTGLLLFQTSMAVQAALDKAIARGLSTLRVQKLDATPGPLYTLNDNACIAFARGGLVLIAKDRATVEQGLSVLHGSTPSLAGAAGLKPNPALPRGAFLVAITEGLGENTALPAKAAIFKQARGAQFTAAETSDQLLLSLSLKTASAEVAQQIQQVIQGLIALVSLSENQDPNLRKLVQSASFSAEGDALHLKTALPVTDIVAKLSQAH